MTKEEVIAIAIELLAIAGLKASAEDLMRGCAVYAPRYQRLEDFVCGDCAIIRGFVAGHCVLIRVHDSCAEVL